MSFLPSDPHRRWQPDVQDVVRIQSSLLNQNIAVPVKNTTRRSFVRSTARVIEQDLSWLPHSRQPRHACTANQVSSIFIQTSHPSVSFLHLHVKRAYTLPHTDSSRGRRVEVGLARGRKHARLGQAHVEARSGLGQVVRTERERQELRAGDKFAQGERRVMNQLCVSDERKMEPSSPRAWRPSHTSGAGWRGRRTKF